MWYRFMAYAIFGYAAVQSPAHGIGSKRWSYGAGRVVQDTVQLATITTDTGDLAPGNTDFSRFTTPGECLGAVSVAREIYRRSFADQMADALQSDSLGGSLLPEPAVAVARSCASRLAADKTAKDAILDLFTLELLGNNDPEAHEIVAHIVATAPAGTARDSVRLATIERYLAVTPRRIAAADSIVAQLDNEGSVSMSVRVQAHSALLFAAEAVFDVSLMRREADQLIALVNGASVTQKIAPQGVLASAYRALGHIAYVEHPDSVMRVMAQAHQQLSRFRPVPGQGRDLSTLTLPELRTYLLHDEVDQFEQKTTLPPLVARYWAPEPPSWPPSQPTLVLLGEVVNYCARYDDGILGLERPGLPCLGLYAYLPRWLQTYGPRLSITVVARGQDFGVRSEVLSPQAEADTLAAFFRTQLQLPVTVGVIQDSSWKIPRLGTAGRISYQDTTEFGRMVYNDPKKKRYHWDTKILLYDGHGVLRYVGEDIQDPMLARIIEHTL